ncbi:MAG: HNH endonuclease signature motif containing protein [Bryobacteraceae bacterium]
MASEISEQLRAEVARRADYRCEYCLLHEEDAGFPHQIDHVISRKHGGSSDFDNLAYACVLCNRHKGSDVASIDRTTGLAVRLFDPRRDRWADHFRLDAEFIGSHTQIGAATVRLLRLNAAERVAERRLLQSLGTYPLPSG